MVAVAVDDLFVGGRLESVDGGLGEERVSHEGEPLDGFALGGDDRRGAAVTLDDDLVEVVGVGLVESAECEVVDDQQVDAQQFAELGVVAVVEPGGA